MLSSPVAPLLRRLSLWLDGPVGALMSAFGPLGTVAGWTDALRLRSSSSSRERLEESDGRDEMRECKDLLEGFSARSLPSRSRACRSRSAA